MLFWCVLHDGRENTLTTENVYEAQRRARALDASKLFVKNMRTGAVALLGF